jgi:hypothetical protein
MACNEFKMNKGCALEEQTTWCVRCAGYLTGTMINYSIHLLVYIQGPPKNVYTL